MISSSSTTRTDPFRELRLSGFITRIVSVHKKAQKTEDTKGTKTQNHLAVERKFFVCLMCLFVAGFLLCFFVALVADGLETGADACGRQGDAESGAVARRAVDCYATRVFLDNSVGDRKTEAGSLSDAFRRVERVVDLGNVLRCDTDTRIGDFGNERSVIRGVSRDDDASTIRNRIARIEDQVREDLLQLARVGIRFGRIFVITSDDLDLAETQLRFE